MASIHGHLPMFSGSAAEWDVFAEQLTYYFVANGIDDADKKRAILLSACGTITYKLLETLVAPAELTAKLFAELVQLAKGHYIPRSEAVRHHVPCFRFNTSVRQDGESITRFVTRLRDLASLCEYRDSVKELIRDRLVCGVRDDALQRTLLAVAKLTYDKAYELAVLHESAAQNSRLLSSSSTTPVHYVDPDPPHKDMRLGKPCYRCGGKHSATTCHFKDVVCKLLLQRKDISNVCVRAVFVSATHHLRQSTQRRANNLVHTR